MCSKSGTNEEVGNAESGNGQSRAALEHRLLAKFSPQS